MATGMLVSGHVQGVGFRYFVRRQALLLGLRGYVRNLSNGAVYCLIQGRPEQINELVRCCYQGPPHARVTNIELSQLADQPFETFDIR